MKLASLKSGSDARRDGRLVVVSKDLAWYAPATEVAPTLQAALDDWDRCAPMLKALSLSLESGGLPRERFHEHEAASPLPRAFGWLDSSAYLNHVALVRQVKADDLPASSWTEPLMYQGGSEGFLAPRDPIPLADEAYGCDLEGEIAVIIGDVALGAGRDEALAAIRLVLLANDVSLRNLIPAEFAKGFGFVQSKPASAFSPVAVTPEALGAAWSNGRLHGALEVSVNGKLLGEPDAGVDMTFDFGALIVHAAKTRALTAGTIIGSGTVSNQGIGGGPGKPVSEGGLGYACIAEVRSAETLLAGEARTPFLRHGDTVRIEMRDSRRHSLFGAIEQRVEPA